ncbi:hypothetical protein, partial [Bacillus phage SPG24]
NCIRTTILQPSAELDLTYLQKSSYSCIFHICRIL